MKVYVDFDNTLFDTHSFVLKLEEVTKKKISALDLANISSIAKENKIDLKKFLYQDTLNFLEKYKDLDLILLTKGDYEYQLFKVEETGIIKYFKEKIITEKSKGELNIDYKNGIFIDDNPKEIESIISQNPYRIIRMKRGKYKDIAIDCLTEEVSNLNEIKL